jgi:hypothetical protein
MRIEKEPPFFYKNQRSATVLQWAEKILLNSDLKVGLKFPSSKKFGD